METIIACSGPLTYNTNGTARCLSGWVEYPYTYTQSFNPAVDIDPVLVAGAVGAGFFGLVPLWFAVVGVRKLVSAVQFR